ncbi:mannan endo-1,4-beta-mannosidase 2-like [Zingiber officinale]|uniref:mannan endo-1,4-beta-mannosidase 2-like n=1 Tax=Zingiber officinale TaxID=94328 RepID=UPI001C4CC366|nr:mannan endo-1,4-beta-mannosidase 2-like [Zingiber officinale]
MNSSWSRWNGKPSTSGAKPSGKRLRPRIGLLRLAIGFALCILVTCLTVNALKLQPDQKSTQSFVVRNGVRFMVDGRVFYVNGWNSFWLMDQAVEEGGRGRVTEIFRAAASLGLTVCRTYAFHDGDRHALQVSLGIFDETVFEALDWVVVEAQRHGIRLLLSLVNNWRRHGGKTQYVKWAWEEGFGLSASNDSFFFDPSIRSYFKIYLKTILTRKNHLSGIEYREDPTIFAWELMNEPRCASDVSGDTLQEWIEEMAEHVKAIDKKHLLTVGLEGFYGPTSSAEKKGVNPEKWYADVGSDFLRNSKIPAIDFASVHIYPDKWLLQANISEKTSHTYKWMTSHIEDGEKELAKPILFSEFGLSNKNKDFDISDRVTFYKSILDTVYYSAAMDGAGAGALIWQLHILDQMENYNDNFSIVPGESQAIDGLLKEQSCRLMALSHGKNLARTASAIC